MCTKKRPNGSRQRKEVIEATGEGVSHAERLEDLRKLRQNWENDARLPKR